ncbi:MAG TPA: ROK family transcriptional regulator [Candidatus Omnitrophota bacterium]|nr:ROK family transcriptional regulator [Candidatus Omnitrophota bacterium]HRZ67728.1 ROK family transcriptional regulator [Candidatus Omnitrophota bacterium]
MRNVNTKNALATDRILSDKQRKNLSILELVVKRGPISRTEISRQTGLNIVTISNYINEFIANGLVVEKGFDVSTGGRRPTLVELNPKFGYMIGVGLTALNIVGILVDPKMQVVCEVKKERPADNSEAIIDRLVETVEEVLAKSKIEPEKIKGLGIGIPGVIDVEGQTIRWLGSMGLSMVSISGVSLKDIFEKEFDIPTLVEHDAACAVFGERWFGFESDINDMIYMYTGVGCGLIINGQIYRGSNGSAGEVGIFNATEPDAEARRKESLSLGTWEIDLGVTYYAREAMKAGGKSRIFEAAGGDPGKINLGLVIEASKAGDKLANELLEDAGKRLGKKIAFLVNLLNPEVVVIGGGVEQAGSLFMDSVKRTINSWSREENIRNLRIVPARLGHSAVAMGAACLVLQRIFMNA